MNRIVWLAVAACAAAAGCSPGVEPPVGPGDPIGFTFVSTKGSFASFGWTGAVHNVEQPAGTPFGVEVTGCSGGVCRFQGPSDPGGKVQRRRCLFPMSKTCSSDSDCTPFADGSANPCVYVYDTPIATPLLGTDGKVGACAWSYIPITALGGSPTISGALNLASGALSLESLSILLPLNSNPNGTFRGPCAECDGDRESNDGIKNGTCRPATRLSGASNAADPEQSPDLGMPCDANRVGTIGGYDGNYSMDCSPTVISTANTPLQFGGSFTSIGFEIGLDDESPGCTTGEPCFCGMCAGTTTACMSDRACGDKSCLNPTPTELMADPARAAVASDACGTGDCLWDAAAGKGTCSSSLPDGSTLGCYPSGLGAIISAPGRAERLDHVSTTYLVDTANARCIPAGRSTALNRQLGLPGLLFQKRNFQIFPRYAEDTP
jgi:hypothetical protein